MAKNKRVRSAPEALTDFDRIVAAQLKKSIVEAPANPNGGAKMPVPQGQKAKDKAKNKTQYMAIFDREAGDSDDQLDEWANDTEDGTESPEDFVHDDDSEFESQGKVYGQGPSLYNPMSDEEGDYAGLDLDDLDALYDKGGVKKLRKGAHPNDEDLDDDYVGLSDDDDDLDEDDDNYDDADDDDDWDDDDDDDDDDSDDFGDDDGDDEDGDDFGDDDDGDDEAPPKKLKKARRRLDEGDDDEVADPVDDADDDWMDDSISEEDEHPQARKSHRVKKSNSAKKSNRPAKTGVKKSGNAAKENRRRGMRKALGTDAMEFVDGSPLVKSLVEAMMDWRDEMIANYRAVRLDNRDLRKGLNTLGKMIKVENRQMAKSLTSVVVRSSNSMKKSLTVEVPAQEVPQRQQGKVVRKGYGQPITTSVRESDAPSNEFNLAKAMDVLESAYQENRDGITMRDITILENDHSPQYLSNAAKDLLTKSHLL